VDELSGVFETVSRYFSILSEPVRVRIVHAICQQERTVNQIVELTSATQTTVSRHLALMYREGVLSRRREGGFVHYKVSDTALAEICRTVCVHIAARDEGAAAPTRQALSVAQDFETPEARPLKVPPARAASRQRASPQAVSAQAKPRRPVTPDPGPKSASSRAIPSRGKVRS
jgi:DNA-binding transcriptional ArsR family regulator